MVTLSRVRRIKEDQQHTMGLDSAEILALVGSGVSVLETLDSLPTTSLTAGDEAFVKNNNKLYISNGVGWYNTTTVNRTPRWITEPSTEYEITDSATPLVITALAADSDNAVLLNQAFASDSAQYMVDVTNDSSVFTFTPKSKDSIGIEVAAGNLTDSNGDFLYTFKWSDGVNFVSKGVTITYNPAYTQPAATIYGDRGITFLTTNGAGGTYMIEYWSVTGTNQNATTFGELGNSLSGPINTVSDGNIGITAQGTTLNYVTAATPGNATTYGSLSTSHNGGGSTMDDTYGLFADGNNNTGRIDYITMQTGGSSSAQFGTTSTQRDPMASALTNGTRGVFAGGYGSSWSTVIDYVTIQTPGNASSLGSLGHSGIGYAGAVYDGTYGCWLGGYGGTGYAGNNINNRSINVIQRIAVATGGTAINYGDLVVGNNNNAIEGGAYGGIGGASDGTYGCVTGGTQTNSYNPSIQISTISRITIATTGNSSSIGDLSVGDSQTGTTQGNA